MAKVYFLSLIFTIVAILTKVSASDSKCNGLECQQTISMPLMDNMRANLKADLDITEMNNYLRAYISQEIKAAIASIVNDTVQRRVDIKIEEERQRLDQKLNDRRTYAFLVTMKDSGENLENKEVVIFDQVSLNDGNVYDVSSGKVTSPEDGYYSFSWTIVSQDEKDFTSDFVVNGNRIVANVVDNDKTMDHLSGTSNVVVKLSKGDKTWIQAQDQGKYLRAKWNSIPCSMFSGFKL